MGLSKVPSVLIGTSGWSYEDWIGPFYATERGMFMQYSRIFRTTEINSTFYSMPSQKMVRGLSRAAPPGFVFSVKLFRGITHKKLLNPRLGAGEELSKFLEIAEPLRRGGRLGSVLIQLPPKPLSLFRGYIEDFLALLPTKKVRFALEFRHKSWLREEVYSLLERYDIGLVVVDEPSLPIVPRVTSDFAYIRWHGRGERPWYYYRYAEDELRKWVPIVKGLLDQADRVFGYFNNHFRGYAPLNALQMLSLLGAASKRQEQKLADVLEYFRIGTLEEVRRGLERASKRGSWESVIAILAGDTRFRRAQEMPDSNVGGLRISGSRVEAEVRDYVILIDVAGRIVVHDCEDWRKRIEEKRICKHVAKLLLVLPKRISENILKDISLNYDEWGFKYGSSWD